MCGKYWTPKFEEIYAFYMHSNTLETWLLFTSVSVSALKGFCTTPQIIKNGNVPLSQVFLYWYNPGQK